MARLIAAAFENNWTSAVGALLGVLRAMDGSPTEADVSALSGHAFRLAVVSTSEGEVGAGGPNYFAARSALALYENLGWRFAAIEAAPASPAFAKRRQEALKRMRKAIDGGRPSIAFGLHVPEFGIVHGYDGDDLIASTSVSSQYGGRIAVAQWPAPGRPQPLRVFIPEKRVKPDRAQAIARLLRFAVAAAREDEPNIELDPSPAVTGLAAYERWAEILDSGAAISPHGQAYCIQALQSGRKSAAAFLRAEAGRTLAANLAERAASAYRAVVLELSRMATLFPYPNGGDVVSAGTRRAGAASVRRARDAEVQAVDALSELLARR